ncbi:hypothetical protein E4U54_005279 [Claviceps lovelessii]|nr:hypothetical protein E4U54_005279 [Claviceps lovelessii]
MEAKAIEPGPSPDSYTATADLACIFDAAHPPCESDRARSRTSTSTSTSDSTTESSAFRPCNNHSPSSPVLMQAYANRPLPRLPSSASSSPPEFTIAMQLQTPGRMTELSTEQGGQSEYRSSAFRMSSTPSTQQYHHHHDDDSDIDNAIFSIASAAPRSNYNPLARSSRRSSQKVHQLIGLQVDVMDNQVAPVANVSPDSSSIRSGPKTTDDHGVPDYCLVPVLEADDDKHSSRGSSWGPMSPETDAIPAPLNIHKPFSDESYKSTDGLSESFLHMDLDDDILLPWELAHGQFVDVGAAGEYHRFTADLASRHSRHSRELSSDGVSPPTASSKKKRSSLGLAFSPATLFSRRRERSDSVHSPSSSMGLERAQQQEPRKTSRQFSADFIAGPAYPSLSALASPRLPIDVAPPRPPPAPPLRSAWDSDSESDEVPVMSSLKDWFAHRATEEVRGQRRISSASRINSDGQVHHVPRLREGRGLLARRQEREKQIKQEKAAKRREARQGEFKKSLAMIPKEFGFSSSRFT